MNKIMYCSTFLSSNMLYIPAKKQQGTNNQFRRIPYSVPKASVATTARSGDRTRKTNSKLQPALATIQHTTLQTTNHTSKK
jgi:hypothetical protein